MGRRRISNPFEGGLPSRIYVAAFPRYRSSYEIAEMVVPESSAKNSSGRILKLVERFPKYFRIKTEQASRYKMRTLIMSEAQPFFSRLSQACQLSQEEMGALENFELYFRKIMDVYLELTLERDPYYLTRSINAFDELSSALCLTLYMARICSQAPQQATKFSFSMLKITLPGLLGASEISDAEWSNLAKNLTRIASQQTITDLYTKIRKIVPASYELAFKMLEGFEKYYKEVEKIMNKRSTI